MKAGLLVMRKVSIFDYTFIGTLIFFALSFIHITLAIGGLFCFISPFVIKGVTKKNLWCKAYCPRASLLVKVFSRISMGLKPPAWLFSHKTKKSLLLTL